MKSYFQNLILEMVQKSPRPIKDISEEVGKPYSTLMRELYPEDKGAKLGVEMLLPLMKACDSVTPLVYLAESMGYRVVCNKDINPDKNTFYEELLDTYQALVDYHRAMLDGQSIGLVSHYREILVRQLKEDFVFYKRNKVDSGLAGDEAEE